MGNEILCSLLPILLCVVLILFLCIIYTLLKRIFTILQKIESKQPTKNDSVTAKWLEEHKLNSRIRDIFTRQNMDAVLEKQMRERLREHSCKCRCKCK